MIPELTDVAALPADLTSQLQTGLCDGPGSVVVAACNLPLPLPGGVGAVTDAITGGLGDAAMRGVTGFVVDGAVWLIGQVATAVTASTQVRVQAGWFAGHYQQMTGIAAVFTAAFLLLTAASTMLHRDPARLGRAVGMVAAAGLGTGAVLVITDLLLAVSDQLSATVARGMAGDLRAALTGAAGGLGSLTLPTAPATGAGVPLFAVLLAGLLAAAAAVVIWVELLLREVALYAVVLFFPLALAGLAWEPARAWARRLAELLGALIFAKFVIVAVLSLAAGGLASGGDQDAGGFGGVLAGAALLVVAAFSPFLLLRLIGVMEVATAATMLEGTRGRGTRPIVTGARTAMYAAARHHGPAASSSGRGMGAITVAGAGAPWAAGAAAARPPIPLRPATAASASLSGHHSARGA